MDDNPAPEPKATVEPKVAAKAPARARSHAKKQVTLPIPEELLILAIDDSEGVVSAPMKTVLRYGLAGAFLAELVRANKLHLAEDRLTLANTAPSGDALFDDILAMITADKKPRKLGHWIQSIGSKLTIKQVAIRLAELKVIGVENKRYTWVRPYPAFPQGEATAKYMVKQHIRGIVLAGELASPADITLLGLLKACRLERMVFTRDERKSADEKVDALVQGEVYGEAVAKVLAGK